MLVALINVSEPVAAILCVSLLMLGFLFVTNQFGLMPPRRIAALVGRDPATISRRPPMLPRHEHAFRYPPIPNLPRFGILAVTLFTLAIGLVMLLAPMKERWLGITIGVLMVALALLLPSYVLFANRRRLVVDAQGIRLEGSLGRTMIPWQEVTALECSEVRGRVYQNVWYVAYRVWSKRRKIAFYKQLAGCEELAALVSDAAGMDWS